MTRFHPTMTKEVNTMASIKWYWFRFSDGYEVCCRGMDRTEKAAEERKHGKLVRKWQA